MAVVKANAYGHGATHTSNILLENGADILGVAFIKEAIHLRRAGIKAPIALLSGIIHPEQLYLIPQLNIQPFVYSKETVRAIASTAIEQGRTVKVHLKIDTGMGRLGIPPEDTRDFLWFTSQLEGIEVIGLASHLACADEDEYITRQQLETFKQTVNTLKQLGVNFPYIHLANSAAIINYPDTHFNTVRPGLMLYGVYSHFSLKPVLTLKTRIAFLKTVPAGTPISYGHTYVTENESLIATLPIGYADGFNRLLSNRGQVIVRGQRAPVVGLVCMDYTLINVSHIPGVQSGDEVTLIGKNGFEEITVSEVANLLDTIPYEVLCSIGPRITRIYL